MNSTALPPPLPSGRGRPRIAAGAVFEPAPLPPPLAQPPPPTLMPRPSPPPQLQQQRRLVVGSPPPHTPQQSQQRRLWPSPPPMPDSQKSQLRPTNHSWQQHQQQQHQHQMVESLRWPSPLPPRPCLERAITDSSAWSLNRAHLDSASENCSLPPRPGTPGRAPPSRSLTPSRVRLDTGDTTLPVSHLSPVPRRSSPSLDGSGDVRGTSDGEGCHRETLKISNRSRRDRDDDDQEAARTAGLQRLNTPDLLDVAVGGIHVDSAPTPLACNKSRSKLVGPDDEEWLPSMPSGENSLWRRGKGWGEVGIDKKSGAVAAGRDDDDVEEDGSVFFDNDFANDDDDNTTRLYDENRVEASPDAPDESAESQSSKGQVSVKKSKKIELTADETIMKQIVAAAAVKDNGEESVTSTIVSSLSDTISYRRRDRIQFRRRDGREEGGVDRRERYKRSGASKPNSSMSVMVTLMKRGFSRRGRSDVRDTVTTTATGESLGHQASAAADNRTIGHSASHKTLETIDRSLEQHLFATGQQESQRRMGLDVLSPLGVGSSHSSNGRVGKGPGGVGFPSPLEAEIDRETESWSQSTYRRGVKGPGVDVPSPLGAEIDREKRRSSLTGSQPSGRRGSRTNSAVGGKLGWASARSVQKDRMLLDKKWASSRHAHQKSPGVESKGWTSAHNHQDSSPGSFGWASAHHDQDMSLMDEGVGWERARIVQDASPKDEIESSRSASARYVHDMSSMEEIESSRWANSARNMQDAPGDHRWKSSPLQDTPPRHESSRWESTRLQDMPPKDENRRWSRWTSTRNAHDTPPRDEISRWAKWTSGSIVQDMPPVDESSSKENSHHRRSISLNSNNSELGNSSGGVGIKASWLISSPSGVQPLNSTRKVESQTALVGTPEPGEDLIDVTYDEPVDPFSGCIGMPASMGCDRSIVSGDGDSYIGWNDMIGTSVASSSLSLIETPGNTSLKSNNGNEPVTMASSSRPPLGRLRIKSSTFDEFDPITEEEMLGSSSPRQLNNNHPASVASAGIPPRHYKDDPLLSNSRYRSPLQRLAAQRSNKSARKNPSSSHRRSSSLEGGAGSMRNMMMGNTCMIGSIALLEATKTPITPLGDVSGNLNCTSLEWDGSVGHSAGWSVDCQSALEKNPRSIAGDQVIMTPNGHSSSQEVSSTNNLLGGKEGDDDDDSSYGSFSEEYNRSEQKRKIVAKEMKHIIGKVLPIGKPVVKVGRKLLGKEKKKASMKRAEGCLT